MSHHVADAAGNKIELKLDLRMLFLDHGAQAAEQGIHTVMQRQAPAPFLQAFARSGAVRTRFGPPSPLNPIGRHRLPAFLEHQGSPLLLPDVLPTPPPPAKQPR